MAAELGDLRVLVAAAACGSLSAAARELRLSQPAVSERLARLERTVGRPLLVRSNRGVIPTPAGSRFVDDARRCLDLVERAVEAARGEDTAASLAVTAYAGYGNLAVPFLVRTLRPLRVALTVDDQHSDEALRRVAAGSTDLAFTLPDAHAHEVELRRFVRDPVIAICPPGHPVAGRRVAFAELADEDLAYNAWGDGFADVERLLQEMPGPRHRRFPVSPAELVVRIVRAGLALGLVTRSAADGDLRAGVLAAFTITDLPAWHVDVMVAYRRDRAGEPAIGAVLEAVGGRS